MDVSERIMKLNEVIFTFIPVITIPGLTGCLVYHRFPPPKKEKKLTMFYFQRGENKWSNSIRVTGLISSV